MNAIKALHDLLSRNTDTLCAAIGKFDYKTYDEIFYKQVENLGLTREEYDADICAMLDAEHDAMVIEDILSEDTNFDAIRAQFNF